MKNNTLYVLVGIPGSGKSTFLENNNLTLLTVSPDTIREVFFAPSLNEQGYIGINNENNDKVFSIMKNQILPMKLKGGAPVFIDATSLHASDIKDYAEIGKEFSYKTEVIDFGYESLDFYKERNNIRPKNKRLPETSIERLHKQRGLLEFPEGITVRTPEYVAKHLSKTAEDVLVDLSDYNKLHFIGDIQGCNTVLEKFMKENPFKDDEFFIFIGDYIDRGMENAEALSFVEKNIGRKNCIFMKGNHEENLYKYAILNEEKYLATVFKEETLEQLTQAGFTKERMANIYNQLDELNYIKYNGKKILVSHAGLNTIPMQPMLVNKDANNEGYSFYSVNIDKVFDDFAQKEWFQVHGHRNDHALPTIANKRSFNLEGGVEYGEDLRVVSFEKGAELTPVVQTFKNDIYMKGKLKMNEVELQFNEPAEVLNEIRHEGDLLTNLRDNPLINESISETYPHISSFNFTKKAFYESETAFLQELVSQARGLFINNQTGEVVSRGFEKFFNVGELPSSTMDSIENTFTLPLTLYKKENGFFGTIGYDSVTDDLIITSKSRIEGEFPDLFNNIVKNQFNDMELNKLKRYAQKYNVNYIFEVNDPENDPHIVEYDNKHVVLLAIVKRDFNFQDVKYEDLKKFGESFNNLPVKQLYAQFKTIDAFKGFYNAVASGNKEVDFEGFVVEDANSNKVKIKAPYYSGWKFMRGCKDYYNRTMKKFEEGKLNGAGSLEQLENTLKTSTFSKIDNYDFIPAKMKPELKEFYTWFMKQDKEVKSFNIIDLRKQFREENKPVVEVAAKAKLPKRKM